MSDAYIATVEKEYYRPNAEDIHVGDTVKVHFRIIEGATERIQIYEGIVISLQNTGVRKTAVIRKISYKIGVERIFPIHSPRIEKIEIIKRGKVRRAKLYYMRDRIGKAAMKVKENRPHKKTA